MKRLILCVLIFLLINLPLSGARPVVGQDPEVRNGNSDAGKQNAAAYCAVSLYGYSAVPRRAQNSSGGLVIPRGGGSLQSRVGPMAMATFAHNDTMTLQIAPPPAPPITIDVHDPSKPKGDRLELDPASLDLASSLDSFPENGGYIIIVSVGMIVPGGGSASGAPTGGAEFAYYTRRNGTVLMGVTSATNIPNPLLAQQGAGPAAPPPTGPGAGNRPLTIATTRQIHLVRVTGGGMNGNRAAVFPISINVAGATGYAQPETVQKTRYRIGPPRRPSLRAPERRVRKWQRFIGVV